MKKLSLLVQLQPIASTFSLTCSNTFVGVHLTNLCKDQSITLIILAGIRSTNAKGQYAWFTHEAVTKNGGQGVSQLQKIMVK